VESSTEEELEEQDREESSVGKDKSHSFSGLEKRLERLVEEDEDDPSTGVEVNNPNEALGGPRKVKSLFSVCFLQEILIP
jgi:hypothetical protein